MAGIFYLIKLGLTKAKDYLYDNRDFFVPLPRELREYPAGRTKRTPLAQKFLDTFKAFFGKPSKLIDKSQGDTPDNRTPSRWGIFDYLTLGIPRLLTNGLLGLANLLKSTDYTILQLVSYVPWALGKIVGYVVHFAVRVLIAAVATIVVSPVVIVTHLVSWLVGEKQYNAALQLESSSNQPLSQYLNETRVDANDLRLVTVSKIRDQDNNKEVTAKILFCLSPKGATGDNPRTFVFAVPAPQAQQPTERERLQQQAEHIRGEQTQRAEDGQPNAGSSQRASLEAVLKLNLFKTQSHTKEQGKVQYVGTDMTEAQQALENVLH